MPQILQMGGEKQCMGTYILWMAMRLIGFVTMVMMYIKIPTFQELQGSTSTSRNMRHFIFSAPLSTAGGSVTTTNNGGAASLGCCNYHVHNILCSACKLLKFKYTTWAESQKIFKLADNSISSLLVMKTLGKE